MKAIVMKRPGGPETLDAVDRPEPVLGGQALVEVASAGMNFMDISPALYMPARVVQVGRSPRCKLSATIETKM